MPEWSEHLRPRLALLKLSPPREAEIAEELSQHLDERYEELRAAGATDDEAHRLAIDELLEPDALAYYMQSLRQAHVPAAITPGIATHRLFEDLWQDLRYAVRMLRKQPGFAVTAVLTLALGIGANTAIFSMLHAVVLRDLPYHEADRLALLWTLDLGRKQRDGSSYLNFRDWKEHSRAFEEMAVVWRPEHSRSTLTGGSNPERVHVALVGPRFFEVLRTPALLGRTFGPSDFVAASRAVVISHSLWRQRFAGDPDVIGRSIELEGAGGQVVGVMPSEFEFPTAAVSLWQPISVRSRWETLKTDPRTRGDDGLMVIGRLSPAATFEAARAEMDTIAARLRDEYPDSNTGRGVLIERLTGYVIGSRTERSIWLLFGAVGFVLLIACANVANLALARGAARRQELSLRIAIGASRMRLVRQALTESVVLAVLAAGVGIPAAWFVAAGLRRLAAGALPRLETVHVDATVLLFALAVSLTCGVLAGLLPALQLSTVSMVDVLRDSGPRSLGGARARRLRHGLVVAELALAVVLLSGAGLLIRSFARVQAADRGFDSQKVLVMQVDLPEAYEDPVNSEAFFRQALERIRTLPGVAAAGAVSDFFITHRNADARIVVEGKPPARPDAPAPQLLRDVVIPGYFEAMRIPLVKGRLLRDGDLAQNAPRVGVINETMARAFWPGEDAVGKRLKWGQNPSERAPWITVVGVVPDMRRQRLDLPPVANMFQAGVFDQMDVTVRAIGDPDILREAIRAEFRALDPLAPPYGVVTAEHRLGETVALRTLQMLLLGALAAAALLLAIIGVYGIVHHSTVARTQEIGIRMALGASRGSVLGMILSGALGLAASGLALGLTGAFMLGQTIASLLYETSPLDPAIYTAVAALLAMVTTIACLPPARRAARVDPMTALRHE